VPLAGYFAWTGLLARLDYIDEAGASVVHLAAGMSALAVAILVGPRTGKYNRDGSSNMIPGHSLPMASVGVIVMLVAWGPYVLGAGALYRGFGVYGVVNVLLAGSAGALAALAGSVIRFGKPDAMLTYRSDRHTSRPWGLAGGLPGQLSSTGGGAGAGAGSTHSSKRGEAEGSSSSLSSSTSGPGE